MNGLPSTTQAHRAAPPWHASLSLRFAARDGRTVMADAAHTGPLRVQRPLYADDREACEVLVLHPPGGMAGGDVLEIAARVESCASVLVSTPGAAKWYRAAGRSARQSVQLEVADHATLEWLPQEAILFAGAQAEQSLAMHIEGDARLLGWDLVQLGRTAAGDAWPEGTLRQRITLHRGERLVWCDQGELAAADGLRHSAIGLHGCPVFGTFWAAAPWLARDPETLLEQVRAVLPDAGFRPWSDTRDLPATPASGQPRLCVAATWLPAPAELLLVRGLADEAEALRDAFEAVWGAVRPVAMERAAIRPRIWST